MALSVNGTAKAGKKVADDRWARARNDMVKKQIITKGIRDSRVIEAMRRVPRHAFVPEAMIHQAYSDMALPIGQGQTISQPFMVAISLEALRLRGDEKVLEIGAGSGYVTALLSELADSVRSIERLSPLADAARSRLEALGHSNFLLRASDGSYGWADEAPFDAIIAAAAARVPPRPWFSQLGAGGRLVLPVGDRSLQRLVRYECESEGKIRGPETLVNCVYVKLVGEFGWPDEG